MILMNDFKSEPPELREVMLGAARRVLDFLHFCGHIECSDAEQLILT